MNSYSTTTSPISRQQHSPRRRPAQAAALLPTRAQTRSLSPHFHAESGFRDRGLVLLRQVELALLLKTRAHVALSEGLVLGQFLGERLAERALRRNGPGRVGSWS